MSDSLFLHPLSSMDSTETTMSYKFGVFGGGTGSTEHNPSSNDRVFATHEEAEKAGKELLCRWTQPEDFVVIEVRELVNSRFNDETGRPEFLKDANAVAP